ncbi:unnamed protein product, partial [Mesorhabditis belari]|uniref:Receptor protein-tyrosine kinase n=1 Tax=Mesorhabditis belari TaxID=2138241 RepID=A0AAF3J8B4_9BILA
MSGDPPPFISWSKNGIAMTDSVNASIVLPKVDTDDSGVYECVGKNRVGEVRRSITLELACVLNFVILWRRQKARARNQENAFRVAVKEPFHAASIRQHIINIQMLADELKLMSLIPPHPNVLTLIGAVTDHLTSGRLCVVTELCANGSLEKFLKNLTRNTFCNELRKAQNSEYMKPDRKNRGNTVELSIIRKMSVDVVTDSYIPWTQVESQDEKHDGHEKTPIVQTFLCSTSDLLSFAMQIASGMEFLSEIPCIHRDLAARNIVITEKNICRIADFGLARRANKSYYRKDFGKHQNDLLPLQWMSPESIESGYYTQASDVWSYGILLYELFTLGDRPYPGIPLEEIYPRVRNGERNKKPEFVHDDLYNFMLKCWNSKTKERPLFKDCVQKMREHLEMVLPGKAEEIEGKLASEVDRLNSYSEWRNGNPGNANVDVQLVKGPESAVKDLRGERNAKQMPMGSVFYSFVSPRHQSSYYSVKPTVKFGDGSVMLWGSMNRSVSGPLVFINGNLDAQRIIYHMIIVSAGQNLSLRCQNTTDGFEEDFRKRVTVEKEDERTQLFHIRSLKQSDTGTYSCLDDENDSDNLYVFVEGLYEFLKPKTYTLDVTSSKFLLPCRYAQIIRDTRSSWSSWTVWPSLFVDGEEWLKDSKERDAVTFDSRYGFEIDLVKLNRSLPMGSGRFRCVASKGDEVEWFVRFASMPVNSVSMTTPDWFSPRRGLNKQNVTAVQCDLRLDNTTSQFENQLQMQCPRCRQKDGPKIQKGVQIHGNSTLFSLSVIFEEVKRDDSGLYTCSWPQKVVNKWDAKTQQTFPFRIFSPLYRMHFAPHAEVLTVFQGEPIRIKATILPIAVDFVNYTCTWHYERYVVVGRQKVSSSYEIKRMACGERPYLKVDENGVESYTEELFIPSHKLAPGETYRIRFYVIEEHLQMIEWKVKVDTPVKDFTFNVQSSAHFVQFDKVYHVIGAKIQLGCHARGDVDEYKKLRLFYQRSNKIVPAASVTGADDVFWNTTVHEDLFVVCKRRIFQQGSFHLRVAGQRPAVWMKRDPEISGEDPNRIYRGDDITLFCRVHMLADILMFWVHNKTVLDESSIMQSFDGDSVLLKMTIKNISTNNSDCKMTGDPTPFYSWSKNGIAMRDNESLLVNTSIVLTKVDADDSGVYECVGKNRVGEVRRSITLEVKDDKRRRLMLAFVALSIVFLILLACVLHFVILWRRQKARARNQENAFRVAVKEPFHAASIRQHIINIQMLADELKLMSLIPPHPNVLTLIGAVTDHLTSDRLCVVTELCANGSLEKFLKNLTRNTFCNELRKAQNSEYLKPDRINRGNTVELSVIRKMSVDVVTDSYIPWTQVESQDEKHDGHEKTPIVQTFLCSTSDLLSFAMQIANGMEFLSEIPCIHRDLAARNILITEKNICRIADFGLARSNKSYYRKDFEKHKNDPLPLQWMSPESIESGYYTQASDVWSYGILLYELFTLGDRPYPGIPLEEIYPRVRNGVRNEKPKFAHDDLYNFMLKCWNSKTKERPLFKDCVQKMREHLEMVLPGKAEEIEGKLASEVDRLNSYSEWRNGNTENANVDVQLVKGPESAVKDLRGVRNAKQMPMRSVLYSFASLRHQSSYYSVKPLGKVHKFAFESCHPGAAKTFVHDYRCGEHDEHSHISHLRSASLLRLKTSANLKRKHLWTSTTKRIVITQIVILLPKYIYVSFTVYWNLMNLVPTLNLRPLNMSLYFLGVLATIAILICFPMTLQAMMGLFWCSRLPNERSVASWESARNERPRSVASLRGAQMLISHVT